MSSPSVSALRITLAAVLLASIALFGRPTAAGEPTPLPKPSGAIILTVTGAIANTNAPGRAEFDLPMLEALGTETLITTTNWTDGPQRFEGVRVERLLAAVGATGAVARASALNDYAAEIPLEMFEDYPALLAFRQNGKGLTVRDKGPVWIVFPRDDFPSLDDPRVDLLWVWQLVSIEVR
jgi:hypothetical protein